MTEQLTVTTERVDDIPIVLAQSDDMAIADLLDEYFKPHGNWEGTSLGWTTAVWLTHIVSEGDHRMNQVQGWVAQRVQTLQGGTGQEVRGESWSDDRLALVLDALAQPEGWHRFEAALNRRLIRVYQLQPQRVRLDSTTVSGYWSVTEDGLFQLGYSKDHRPDLPQLKVMLSALDPLGLPLVRQVVAGKPPMTRCTFRRSSKSVRVCRNMASSTWGTARWRPCPRGLLCRHEETPSCVLWPRHNCQHRSWTGICSQFGAASSR